MKNFLVAAVALVVTGSSFAIVRPGWERPIAKANMHIVNEPSNPTASYTLVMTKQDGAKRATGFSLTTEQKVFCVVAPCPRQATTSLFRITRVEKDACGSQVFHARELVNHSEPSLIKLADHSRRICKDLKPFKWEMQLSGFKFIKNLAGNPEPVYTIQ